MSDGGPSVLCDVNGTLTTSLRSLRAARFVDVVLPDGRREQLQRAPWNINGMTSKRFVNPRLVLKVADDAHQARRDACILKILRDSGRVPNLLCSREHVTVMENAGEPLTAANLPADYREQAQHILSSLRHAHIAHNDIWKANLNSPSLFAVEMTVDAAGKLRLVDFNTASLNGSYSCSAGIRDTAVKDKFASSFVPSVDEHVLDVLHAMYRSRHVMSTYLQDGLHARHGLCRREAVAPSAALDPLTGTIIPPPQASRLQSCDAPRTPRSNAMMGGFASAGSAWSSTRVPAAGASAQAANLVDFLSQASQQQKNLRLPSAVNVMPSVADVRQCVALCRACPRCHQVSISSLRSACIWFAPRIEQSAPSPPPPPPPSRFAAALPAAAAVDTCESFGGSPPVLRTAWRRPVWAAPTNRSWEQYQRLDDFLTIAVRGGSR